MKYHVCINMALCFISLCLIVTPDLFAARIDPANDMTYLGAFRLPDEESDHHQWVYGGYALAFNSAGDPNGPNDGYPGSLFSAGKDTDENLRKSVSEFSIPVPVLSSNFENMHTSYTLQPFKDITQGYFDATLEGQELKQVRGLCVLDQLEGQTSSKIYWSIWSAYNVGYENLPSQGYSNLNYANLNAQGVWKLKDYDSIFASGYLFEIPKSWADTYLGGKYLAVGMCREGGGFSRGPVLLAIDTYRYSSISPPANNELPTIPLIYYDEDHDTYPDYKRKDEWFAGAWLSNGDKEAVVFLGTKCMGEVCYGTGDDCGDPCSQYKGYHCYPKEPQMLFYDPEELKQVALGSKKPWEVKPYYIQAMSEWIPRYDGCTETQGAAFDRQNGLLYIIEFAADNAKPLIHVFKVGQESKPAAPKNLRIQ
ncbi:MAG: hypothetical protein V1793_12095 [Pseudomonadota bacterium]